MSAIAGVAATAAIALWAFAPLHEIAEPARLEIPQPSPSVAPPAPDAFLPESFAVDLWKAPPPQAEETARPGRGLRIELVGIVREGGRQIAAIYDPDADRLFFAAAGERVFGRTVASIDERSVQLTDGLSTSQLVLRAEGRR